MMNGFVGILGAGQLGCMLALAGYPLGLRFRFLDPSPDAPAGHLAELEAGSYDDPAAVRRFARGLTLATYEFENVSAGCGRLLADSVPLYPPLAALETGQDRYAEKRLFQQLGIPVAPFAMVESENALPAALDMIGVPAVIKTQRMGYDGRGQMVVRSLVEADGAWKAMGGVPLLVEQWIAFERELSILAVRGRDGSMAFYPLVYNVHEEGILRRSEAPAPDLDPALQMLAQDYARRVLETLDYVGVLAIEFFQRDGRLLANEMAPRVHNSGHWSIEGAATSQFENHLRAIMGWPLGKTAMHGHALMINLISTVPPIEELAGIAGAHIHLYRKAPAPRRKLGHITVCADSPGELYTMEARLKAVMREHRQSRFS